MSSLSLSVDNEREDREEGLCVRFISTGLNMRRSTSNALTSARIGTGLSAVVTLIEAWDRGDERMPLVKVHHRYLHGDGAAEGAQAQAQAPHPPGSAITKALVDKNLMHYTSRFLAP